MTPLDRVTVAEAASLRKVLETITRSGKQVALVADGALRLLGVVTDGDLRKAILRGVSLDSKIGEVMNRTPIVGRPGLSRDDALAVMRARAIHQLPLVDGDGRLVDLLTLDGLLAAAPPLPTCAVVMAGGEGKRLRPLTDSTPKPLVRVGGTPIIELLLERLRTCGIEDVVIAVHHRSDMVRQHLGDGRRLGVRIDYVEEPAPLGTMGALTLLRDRLRQPFFVVNGDILTKCDFRAMWEFHRIQDGAAMTVGVSLHQIDVPYGEFTLSGTRVTTVQEKPRKEFPVNAGIYVLDADTVDLIPRGQAFDATDLVRALLADGRAVAAYLLREYWLDVGRLGDFEKANRDIAEGLLE